MGETRFTPGPWEAVDNDVYFEICTAGDDSAQIGDACASMHWFDAGDHGHEGKAWANAHLIAEAPELYRVAEMALNAIQRLAEEHGAIPDYLDDITGPIDAALAKARGE